MTQLCLEKHLLHEKLSTKVQVVIHKSTGKFKEVWGKLYYGTAGYFGKRKKHIKISFLTIIKRTTS